MSYLYKVQNGAKLTYGVRSPESGYLLGRWEMGEGSHGIFAIPSLLKSAVCVCFVAGNSANRTLVIWAVFPYLSYNSIKTLT